MISISSSSELESKGSTLQSESYFSNSELGGRYGRVFSESLDVLGEEAEEEERFKSWFRFEISEEEGELSWWLLDWRDWNGEFNFIGRNFQIAVSEGGKEVEEVKGEGSDWVMKEIFVGKKKLNAVNEIFPFSNPVKVERLLQYLGLEFTAS